MGQVRLTSKVVSLAVGETKRVWDAPSGVPFKDASVFISSHGSPLPAGTLVWTLITGGTWDVGEPFAENSTHDGGISQVSGGILGGVEAAEEVKIPAVSFPPSLPDANGGWGGVPLVLELTNSTAASCSVRISFMSRTVTDVG